MFNNKFSKQNDSHLGINIALNKLLVLSGTAQECYQRQYRHSDYQVPSPLPSLPWEISSFL